MIYDILFHSELLFILQPVRYLTLFDLLMKEERNTQRRGHGPRRGGPRRDGEHPRPQKGPKNQGEAGNGEGPEGKKKQITHGKEGGRGRKGDRGGRHDRKQGQRDLDRELRDYWVVQKDCKKSEEADPESLRTKLGLELEEYWKTKKEEPKQNK